MRTFFVSIGLMFLLVGQSGAQNPTPRPAPVISPEKGENGSVTFRIRAPKEAQEVSLRGQWNRQPMAMTKNDSGVWSVTVESVPAGVWEYSFNVDGLNVLDSLNPAFMPATGCP